MPKAVEGQTVQSKDGRSFVMIPDRLFLQVIYDGIYEATLTNFINSAIRKGDTCVDVGSNFGWFATLMGMTADKVIAYEPLQRSHGFLEENVRLNQQGQTVEARRLAVGPEAGTVTLVVDGAEETESALAHVATDGEVGGEVVNIVPLGKDLSEHLGNIAIIKLDAEGLEVGALEGARELLSAEDAPIVITEANREAMAREGKTRSDLVSLLDQYGYRLFGMSNDGTLYPDDDKAPALACLPPKGQFANRVNV